MKSRIISLIALCIISVGCSERIVPELRKDMCSVSIAIVDENGNRSTKATGYDLYGLQVYCGEAPYAYGLFDNPDLITINLNAGESYKFVIKEVVDAKTSFINSVFQSQGYPFAMNVDNTQREYNSIYYSTSEYFVSLESGSAISSNGIVKYPEIDTYYGELANYSPVANATISLELKHIVFGLQYDISDITDGSVSLSISCSERTLIENTNITDSAPCGIRLFTFEDVKSVWNKASTEYSENLTLAIKWNRASGSIQNLESKNLAIKRNCVNKIHITLPKTNGLNPLIGISVDDTAMSNTQSEITLE